MPEPITPVEPQLSAGEALAAAIEQPPAESTPAPLSVAERVKALGFSDVKDDAEAVERMLAAYQERDAQAQQAARRAQELEELARLREQAAQQSTPPSAPTKSDGKWWNPPTVDEVAVSFYSNPDGTLKETAPPEIRQQVQRYEAYRKQWAAKLTTNPDEALAPAIKEIVKAEMAAARAELEAATQEEAVTQRFIREADWAFMVDPVSKQRRKDHTGAFIPSPEGVKFSQYMDAAASLGIKTVAGQIEYATNQRELDTFRAQQGQAAAAQTTQQANDQKKQELLRRTLPGPSQAGTFSQPGQPPRTQNRNLTAGRKLLDQMQQDGALLPS